MLNLKIKEVASRSRLKKGLKRKSIAILGLDLDIIKNLNQGKIKNHPVDTIAPQNQRKRRSNLNQNQRKKKRRDPLNQLIRRGTILSKRKLILQQLQQLILIKINKLLIIAIN